MKKYLIALIFLTFLVNVVCLAETDVQITSDKQVVDTLDGVSAYYRPGTVSDDGSNSTYGCFAFAKRYFSNVYGVNLQGLSTGDTPSVSSGSLSETSDPQKGDLVFWSKHPNTNVSHSAIVKSVSGNNVTLIEQNWKHNNVAKYERSISKTDSGAKFYRWSNNGGQSSSGSVTFYEHKDGGGWSYSCGPETNVSDASKMNFPNDQLSCVRVSGSNIMVEIFEHDNYNGRRLTFDREGLFNLDSYDFNDICSSYKVHYK